MSLWRGDELPLSQKGSLQLREGESLDLSDKSGASSKTVLT